MKFFMSFFIFIFMYIFIKIKRCEKMTKKKKTIRVTPTIPEDVYNNIKCYNITPRNAIINCSNDLKYGKETRYQLEALETIKAYLEKEEKAEKDRLKGIQDELKKVKECINNISIQQKQMDNEIEKNITKASQEVMDLLQVQYDAFNNVNFKQVVKVKFKEIEAIADKYNVPVKRIFKKEPAENFYKIALENYNKYVPSSLLLEK